MSLLDWVKSTFFKREVPTKEVVTPPDELSIWNPGKPVELHVDEATPEEFAPVTQLYKTEDVSPSPPPAKKKKKVAKKKVPPKIVHARKKVRDKDKKR
jgi:hypothetical protein